MSRRVYQVILGLALLYAGAVLVFLWLRYPAGERPDVLTAARDMHRWAGDLFGRRASAPDEPGTLPPPRSPGGDPAPPPPTAPGPAPAADARSLALRRVRDELLPKAERLVRAIPSARGADLDERKSAARVAVIEARDALGPLLDANVHDRDAQALYQKVMELLIAVDKR